MMTPKDEALQLAAQCWCDEDTKHKEMDPVLAEAFARRLEPLLIHRNVAALRVDPWQLQASLMRISDQRQAAQPELNQEGVLYAALCLEEVGELARTMSVVARLLYGPVTGRRVSTLFAVASSWCRSWSRRIRGHIAKLPHTEPLAVSKGVGTDTVCSVADDLTDLVVVAAGASNAMGLMGNQCYLDVAQSNLSKANPDTGRIDKDSSGKWIKGARYRAPYLHRVLFGDGADD